MSRATLKLKRPITQIDIDIDENDLEANGFVKVVRCKDCTYYVISRLKRDGTADKRYKPSVCVRGEYAKWRRENWYCADGERRSEDG